MFEITSGKIRKAVKLCIYGPEGIGKSTFASKLPDPLFIDTEGSTSNLDVKRLPRPSSYEILCQEVDEVAKNPAICKTLVIDTIDWAEQLIVESILAKHQKKGIEDFGYGNGYVYVKEEFGRFLNRLSDLIDKGINVALTAHAQIRKFEQPDELGAYDRYELKLGKKTGSQTSPLVKEWCDILLFANYKTYSVAVDKEGKKHKAQGGLRVMYASHHPCWDAKNRFGLPDELPFDYQQIAQIFDKSKATAKPKAVKPETEAETMHKPNGYFQQTLSEDPTKDLTGFEVGGSEAINKEPVQEVHYSEDLSGLPIKLQDLMQANKVAKTEIQEVVADRGYFPFTTPIDKYPSDFIDGVLVGAWDQVFSMIQEKRQLRKEMPFY